MGGTYKVVAGNKGRPVVPAEVRERAKLDEGAVMILLETEGGLVPMTQAQLQARVRADLEGTSLTEELLAERRAAARAEDDASA